MDNKFRKSTINLPEYQWNWLEQQAIKITYERKQKISMAEYLRELIDQNINKDV